MSFFSSFFGGQKKTGSGPTTAIDLVMNAVGLASDPAQLGPVLDHVRDITSKLGPGQRPSAQDVAVIFGVYLQIEQYLMTKEPLRSFNKDELRAKIAPALRAQLEQYESTKKGA